MEGERPTTTELVELWLRQNQSVDSVELVTFDQMKGDGAVTYGSPHAEASRYLEGMDPLEALDDLPFWDRVLASTLSNRDSLEPFITELLTHNSPLPLMSISRAGFSAATVQAAISGHTGIVGLSSRVRMTNGEMRHLPMLDFHCMKSELNEENVFRIASLIGGPGYLLDSGKSYHFLGTTLLREDEMPVFLGKALLFAPFVDRPWLAHQLIQRCCVLRISSKRGMIPTRLRTVQ